MEKSGQNLTLRIEMAKYLCKNGISAIMFVQKLHTLACTAST